MCMQPKIISLDKWIHYFPLIFWFFLPENIERILVFVAWRFIDQISIGVCMCVCIFFRLDLFFFLYFCHLNLTMVRHICGAFEITSCHVRSAYSVFVWAAANFDQRQTTPFRIHIKWGKKNHSPTYFAVLLFKLVNYVFWGVAFKINACIYVNYWCNANNNIVSNLICKFLSFMFIEFHFRPVLKFLPNILIAMFFVKFLKSYICWVNFVCSLFLSRDHFVKFAIKDFDFTFSIHAAFV